MATTRTMLEGFTCRPFVCLTGICGCSTDYLQTISNISPNSLLTLTLTPILTLTLILTLNLTLTLTLALVLPLTRTLTLILNLTLTGTLASCCL